MDTMAKSSNVATPFSSIKKRGEAAADASLDCNATCADLCNAVELGPDCIQDCLPGCQQDADDSLPGPETTESTEDGLPVPVDAAEGGTSATEPAPASPIENGSP
ncbi:hypothetical protein BGZ47_005795 [Haplosporangium gracile]|nr:hypothetical protein BGZ47_005795 [Haplosporangium gracile]